MKKLKGIISQSLKPAAESGVVVRPHSLPVLSEPYFDRLSAAEKKLYSIRSKSESNKTVSAMTTLEKTKIVKMIVDRAVKALNLSKIDTDSQDLDTLNFLKEFVTVIDRFGLLTYNEILYVADRGLMGEYMITGDRFVHLSPSNLAIWLDAYKTGARVSLEKRMRELSDRQALETKYEPTEEEKTAIFVDMVNSHIKALLANENFKVVAATTFMDELVRRGIDNPSTEDKKAAWSFVRTRNMKVTDKDEIVKLAKTELYNRFLARMADAWLVLDYNCKPVDLNINN